MSKVVVHGDLLDAVTTQQLRSNPNSWLVIEEGKVVGITQEKPTFGDAEYRDYAGKLIIPVFADLHFHAVQYAIRGLGLNKELLPWLHAYTFKEEARFQSLTYAERIFRQLVNELWEVGSFNLVGFSSLHLPATLRLMEMLDEKGFRGFIGKVNMDCNDEKALVETTAASYRDTVTWLDESVRFRRIKPIVTPRFAPSCTDGLMRDLGRLVAERDLPVQSHLNENRGEIALVKELFPEDRNYYDVYRSRGLTPKGKTVMAHCVHNLPAELEAMYADELFFAHSPASNLNLSSGIMQLRKLLDGGFNIGLASDIAGGDSLFIGTAAVDAIRSSKILTIESEGKLAPVTYNEAFALGTLGGGKFFGETGSFAEGYSADYLVVDDSHRPRYGELDLEERLQQFLYLGGGSWIKERVLAGEIIPKPFA